MLTITVSGPQGSGKTRLIVELRLVMLELGIDVDVDGALDDLPTVETSLLHRRHTKEHLGGLRVQIIETTDSGSGP